MICFFFYYYYCLFEYKFLIILDTFTIYYIQKITNQSIKLNISKKDIAWESDKRFKYSNPVDESKLLRIQFFSGINF